MYLQFHNRWGISRVVDLCFAATTPHVM